MKIPILITRSFSLIFCLIATSAGYALDYIPEDISAWQEKGIVLERGAPGSWEDKDFAVRPVGVYKKDGIYYLYYLAGFDGCWNEHSDVNHQSLGLATSTDGVNFTKYPGNPILKPHDFVPVESHEEGIRNAVIRYIPEKNMWLGFFGVESPGGDNSCPFMGSTAECKCNIEVDAYIYAATSTDGVNWTVQGEVKGAYNNPGDENYPDDFLYKDGQYYLWSHKAQGGYRHSASKGSDYLNLTELGPISDLCWSGDMVHAYLHDDGKTVTLAYDPGRGCLQSDKELFFSETTLDDITKDSNRRLIHNLGQRFNIILKDIDSGLWRWYYNVESGPERATTQLRIHPIEVTDNISPSPPILINVD